MKMIIKQATLQDIPGVLALLKANHVDNVTDRSDGFVTTNITEEQMKVLIEQEDGVTIAKDGDRIAAFALAGSWEYWSEWPFFANMILELPNFSFQGKKLTKENTYQYGPICVDKDYRGTGVFKEVFDASLASMRDRFHLMATFINTINPRSYAAHTKKVQMTDLGRFDYNNNHYCMMACTTDPSYH